MVSTEVVGVLGRSALFQELEPGDVEKLAARVVQRTYRKGERIFHQGDPGDSLYVIVEGLVKVVVVSEHGEEMVLVTLQRSESFGELALIDGRPRSASAETAEPTTVAVLTRTTMLELLAEHPSLTESLLRSLGTLIRRLTEQASDLVFLDLHGRVAKLLVGLAEDRGEEQDGGLLLDLHLTQGDLA
jgi:CRP/FNR family cyclic AMP-dependent transcriptional regulator